MKRIASSVMLLFTVLEALTQDSSAYHTSDSFYMLTPVEVRAIRAGGNSPFTTTNLSKNSIQRQNLGQDLPYLLNQTPSVVVNSDAGTGIGYTGIRIRGTDASRINVTLNGIPYNDAESQGTFFVDLPDFASSTASVQIIRGVGTSSNGAGSFGAGINFSTNEINKTKYSEFNNAGGSFNTLKNTFKAGTGLLGNHFIADLRLSSIRSDGYIDRASSHLRSLHFSTAWLGNRSSLRFNLFLGKEKTYQAWDGVSQADLDAGRRRINYAGTEKPGDPYNNETDNYWQDHYQLFFTQSLGKKITFNTAIFWTKGKGYYEQYKANQDYSTYNLPYPMNGNQPILTSDFIRQLWLDNDFYGNIFSLQYKTDKEQFTFGGGYTRYLGNHFGKLIWASEGLTRPPVWYDLDALKTDFNIYAKEQKQFAKNWYYFLDLQYRHINYAIHGFEDHPTLESGGIYNFFNPKAGISFLANGWKVYASYSIANKEPNRDDFEAATNQVPRPERLRDIELGIEKTQDGNHWGVTLYYMKYKDQLVVTGKINDVGAYTRTNIPDSRRLGVELEGLKKITRWLVAGCNLTLSSNKVSNFKEYIDDYDNGGQVLNQYRNTNIALSPAVIGSYSLRFLPTKKLEMNWSGKYVGKQYLDNTENQERILRAFYVQDLQMIYTLKKKNNQEWNLLFQLNNLFDKKYEPSGYTYNYISGGELSVNNYYFPMAEINFLAGVNLKF